MFQNIRDDVQIGEDTYLADFVNLYGCRIGRDCRIGAFVEVQRGVVIGDRCKLSSHSFLCTGVTLGDDVFIGHGVIFINDKYPVASREGHVTVQGGSEVVPTQVGNGVSIGSGAVILPVTIGDGARIGAGAVVTHDVPAGELWVGNPARVRRTTQETGETYLWNPVSFSIRGQPMSIGQMNVASFGWVRRGSKRFARNYHRPLKNGRGLKAYQILWAQHIQVLEERLMGGHNDD